MARIVRIHEYGDVSVLKIENLDVPPPGADEVQIDVKNIGLNRAEVMFRTHAYLQEAQFPSRLGYEAAGIVKRVGTSVTSFKNGDVVSSIPPPDIARWGTYGELANVPARNLVKHPRNLSFEEATRSCCWPRRRAVVHGPDAKQDWQRRSKTGAFWEYRLNIEDSGPHGLVADRQGNI